MKNLALVLVFAAFACVSRAEESGWNRSFTRAIAEGQETGLIRLAAADADVQNFQVWVEVKPKEFRLVSLSKNADAALWLAKLAVVEAAKTEVTVKWATLQTVGAHGSITTTRIIKGLSPVKP